MSDQYCKKEFIKKKIKNYYTKKKIAKEKINKHYKINKNKDICINHYTNLRGKDPIYKITDNFARRICNILKKQDIVRTFKYNEILGCTMIELKNHLEKLFTQGMSFDNYGEWEVDHIIPLSKFDLNNEDQVKQCFNYKNLQPLWMVDNRKKYNKIESKLDNKSK
jgi:hypothetical protein